MTNEAMTNEPVQSKINWYRSPMDRATLAELNRRSDLLGFLQTLGHLGLLALTGGPRLGMPCRRAHGWR